MQRLLPGLLAALAVASGAPLDNARVEHRSVGAGLKPALATAHGWVGWGARSSVERTMCCWESFASLRAGGAGSCRLERRGGTNFSNADGATPLAGPEMRILARLDHGRPRDVRVYSAGCRVDAGGAAVTWFDGVSAPDSVATLETWAASVASEDAVTALAQHDDPDVDRALDRLLASGPGEVRGQAAFWLGAARGRHGLETLRARLPGEPDEDVREQMLVGLAQNEEPGATEALLQAARGHSSAATRGHALFWIAQRAGDRAAAEIEHALAHDPDEEVKEKAVFALSQLPQDEGVPLLLRTMRENRNPEIRKRAAFWLGQSRDPRALAYFEQVLGSAPARARP